MAMVSYTQRMSLLLGSRVSIKPTVISSSVQRYFSSSLQTSATTSTPPLSSASPWLMVPPTLIPDWEGVYKRKTDGKYCPDCKSTVFGYVRTTQFEVKPNSEVKPEDNDYYHFLNAAENKFFKKKKNLWMPWQTDHLSPDEAICIGSSHGWLAYIHRRNCSLYLYNPFIDSSMPYLPLPPIETLPPVMSSRRLNGMHIDSAASSSSSVVTEFMIWKQMLPISAKELSERFFRKLAMSSAPTPCCSSHYQNVDQDSHCTVMAILHHDHPKQLVFCRIGDTKWTTLDSDECYADLLYFSKNKLFYALCDSGSIESWDLTDPSSPKRSLAISTVPPHFSSDSTQYLVESSGDLLMVIRHWGDCPNDLDNNIMTWKFDVYKRDFVENNWVHVPSLNDHILFIGQNHAVSLSAHEFPGLRKNSIYFTPEYLDLDEQSWGCWDLGVFNLENKILYQFDLRLEIQASPIWVVPQL